MAGPFYHGLSPLLRIAFGSVAYPFFYLGLIAVLFRGLRPILEFATILKDMLAREG